MKITPPPRPRLACRIVRHWRFIVPDGGSRHVGSCADCRAYFDSSRAIDAALQRDAGAWSRAAPAPSVGFERRIVNAVAGTRASVSTTRPRAGRVAWAASAVLAVVAALVIFRPASGPTHESSQADAAMLADAVQAVSRGLVETVIPSAGALVANNPMQREFDAVYADARSVLGFLAMNFLPSTPPGAPPVPARPI